MNILFYEFNNLKYAYSRKDRIITHLIKPLTTSDLMFIF